MRISLKTFYYFIGYLSSLAFLFGCASDENSMNPVFDETLGTEYYPLAVGRYAIYDVEDIRYTVRDGIDTNRYQLRERVADTWSGAGGEIIYSLERYTRDSPENDWQLDSVWTARKSERAVVVVENNVAYTKLVFPFRDALEWNGNALNSRPELRYRLTTTDSSLRQEISATWNDPSWNDYIEESRTVVQRQLETLINDSVLTETYAPELGLLYKKTRILHYCADDDCIGQKQIVSGISYRQTLLTYGED